MSLINDVLKKLEHRRVSTDPLYSLDKQAKSPENYRERHCLKRSMIIFLSLLVIGFLVAAGYYGERYVKQKHQLLSAKKLLLTEKHPHLPVLLAAKVPSPVVSTMVILANPAAQPSVNSQLPPPSDLPESASQGKLSRPIVLPRVNGAAGTSPADAATLNVPLSALQTAAPTNLDDAGSFSIVETKNPDAVSNQQLEYIDKLGQVGEMKRAETLFAQLPSTTNSQNKVILEAKLLSLQNKNDEAIRVLEQFNQKNTPSIDTLGMLAALLNETGQYYKAQIIYQQLVDFWPNDPAWWLGLGISAMNNEQYALAISAFQRELTFGNELTPEVSSYVRKNLLRLMNLYHI